MVSGQILLFLLALCFALAAGLVGCIALMKRMLLAGDAILAPGLARIGPGVCV